MERGDVVEVITQRERMQPSEDWLQFCNRMTARLLRPVLVTAALKQTAEVGLHMLRPILAEAGISRDALGWTTINIIGPGNTNRPGVLAYLVGLVSSFGGNILRTVNNTFNDGSFTLRWVIQGLDAEQKQSVMTAFLEC